MPDTDELDPAIFDAVAEEHFRRRVEPLGGVSVEQAFFAPVLDSVGRHLQARLQQQPMKRPKPTVHFGLIQNPRFRCFSERSGWIFSSDSEERSGMYSLGLCEGTLYLLADFFNRCFAARDFLPDVGASALETNENIKIRNLYSDLESHFKFSSLSYEEGFELVRPVCQERRYRAGEATVYATLFLMQHELTHVLNGHLDLLGVEGPDSLTNGQHQALEYDADSGAVLSMMIAAKVFCASQPTNKLADVLVEMAMAAYATLLFFTEDNLRRLPSSKHPPVRVRQMMVAGTWVNQFARGDKTLQLELGQRIAERVAAVEEAFTMVTVQPLVDVEIVEQACAHPFSREFSAHWRDLYPKLLPHAYVHIPPPQEQSPTP